MGTVCPGQRAAAPPRRRIVVEGGKRLLDCCSGSDRDLSIAGVAWLVRRSFARETDQPKVPARVPRDHGRRNRWRCPAAAVPGVTQRGQSGETGQDTAGRGQDRRGNGDLRPLPRTSARRRRSLCRVCKTAARQGDSSRRHAQRRCASLHHSRGGRSPQSRERRPAASVIGVSTSHRPGIRRPGAHPGASRASRVGQTFDIRVRGEWCRRRSGPQAAGAHRHPTVDGAVVSRCGRLRGGDESGRGDGRLRSGFEEI